jgi:hypothetical protein
MFTKGLLPDREYALAVGYVVMKLTGTKSRSTKFHATKMVGQSASISAARSVCGVSELMPGR